MLAALGEGVGLGRAVDGGDLVEQHATALVAGAGEGGELDLHEGVDDAPVVGERQDGLGRRRDDRVPGIGLGGSPGPAQALGEDRAIASLWNPAGDGGVIAIAKAA